MGKRRSWRESGRMLLMVLVAGYLVTIEPSFLSSPNPQPTPFFYVLLSSCSTLAVYPAFFVSIPLILIETSVSLPSLSCPASLLFFLFCLFLVFFIFSSLTSVPPPPTLLPFLHPVHYPLAFGLLASIKVFLILFPLCPSSPSISLSSALSFSCDSQDSHALLLYRCLWERRRPTASN